MLTYCVIRCSILNDKFWCIVFSFICFLCLNVILVLFLGAGAVKSEAAILKQSHLEQMKNSSWPESKYCRCYGIQ